MLVNLSFKFVPRPLTTVMIAIEMPAAIRPYSIAVAPDWSFRKRAKSLLMGISQPKEPGALPRRDCSPVKTISEKRMKRPTLVSQGYQHKSGLRGTKKPRPERGHRTGLRS